MHLGLFLPLSLSLSPSPSLSLLSLFLSASRQLHSVFSVNSDLLSLITSLASDNSLRQNSKIICSRDETRDIRRLCFSRRRLQQMIRGRRQNLRTPVYIIEFWI